MEGSNKNISPKQLFAALKNSSFGTRESNEYDSHRKPKKQMAKHFMSPTISAASKIDVRRTKILGERNGIPPFSDADSQNNLDFGSRTNVSDQCAQRSPDFLSSNELSDQTVQKITPTYSFVSDSDDSEKSVMVAYNPASSYLSLRPKYLRFNPDKKLERSEIYDFVADESDSPSVVDEDISSSDDQESLTCSDCFDFQNVVDEEVICADDHESLASGVGQKLLKAADEENKIDHCLDAKRNDSLDSENGISQAVVRNHCYGNEVEENVDAEIEECEEEVERYEVRRCSFKGIIKFIFLVSILVVATCVIFPMDSTILNYEEVTSGPNYGLNSIQPELEGRDEHSMLPEYDQYDIGLMDECREIPFFAEASWINGTLKNDVLVKPNECNNVLAKAKWIELFYDTLNVDADVDRWFNSTNGGEMVTKAKCNGKVQTLEDDCPKYSDQLITVAKVENDDPSDGSELEGRKKHSIMLPEYDQDDIGLMDECREIPSLAEASQTQSVEPSVKADMVKSDDMLEESNSYVNDESSLPWRVDDIIEESIHTWDASESMSQPENKSCGPITIAIIGALISMISGSFYAIFRSKGRQDLEHPLVSKITPIENLDLPESPCPVIPKLEEKRKEKLPEPCAAKRFSEIQVPTVQLLGEIVFREFERSLQRCDQKGVELIESEASTLEYSTVDSSSCFGSFTTEAKILKKEKGKCAEFTTPVRRSSRIRSRSVTPLH